MATCKRCGAKIVWIETPGKKMMPCDPVMQIYWARPKARGKIVTPNGEVISCDFEGDPDQATGLGFIPHWATCRSGEKERA